MAEIDTSFYKNQTPNQVDVGTAVQTGMKMRDFLNKKKDREHAEAVREATAWALRPDKDGRLTVDKSALGQLAQIDPEKAMALQQHDDESGYRRQQQQYELANKMHDALGALLPGVKDQATWDQARANWTAMGFPGADRVPQQYDPGFVAQMQKQIEGLGAQRAERERAQNFQKEGYSVGPDGKLSVDKGGKADLDRQKTRAEIGELNAKAAKEARAGAGGGGKVLPASQAESAGMATAASKALDDVTGLVQQNGDMMGPVTGRVSSLLGSAQIGDQGMQAANLKAAMKQRAQVIGKYLEGGKLTDADIGRYVEQLPNLSDSPEVAQAKVASLRRLLSQKQQSELDALQAAGYGTGQIPRTASPEFSDLRGGALKAPKQGHSEDGYVFMGGDPANPKSWKKAK